jgi:hypothetical protein
MVDETMEKANEYQIGGDHYRLQSYQHWDMVYDTRLNYFLSCATKYLSRYHRKNGVEDLRKAKHFLEKYDKPRFWDTIRRHLHWRKHEQWLNSLQFEGMTDTEKHYTRNAIYATLQVDTQAAICWIDQLLDLYCEPTSRYTNQ